LNGKFRKYSARKLADFFSSADRNSASIWHPKTCCLFWSFVQQSRQNQQKSKKIRKFPGGKNLLNFYAQNHDTENSARNSARQIGTSERPFGREIPQVFREGIWQTTTPPSHLAARLLAQPSFPATGPATISARYSANGIILASVKTHSKPKHTSMTSILSGNGNN